MEQEKNKNGIIALLIIIIVILSVLVILLATRTINFKTNDSNNDQTSGSMDNVETNNNTTNDKVDIKLSIDNVKVSKDAPNAKISVEGTIKLSYDNNKYAGVTLSGYCLGADNEKYLIHGPGDGGTLFRSDNSSLYLTEDIPQEIKYSDGTAKAWSEIDWDNVTIKYCKIDKMTAILNEGTNNTETTLNTEKHFK